MQDQRKGNRRRVLLKIPHANMKVMKVVDMNNICSNLLTYTHAYIRVLHIHRQPFITEFVITELTLYSCSQTIESEGKRTMVVTYKEIQVADKICRITQTQYTDTGPASLSADPITPGAWQGSRWNTMF